MQRETRVFKLGELRADGDDAEGRKFSGHASVFNQLSAELWGFYERVSPKAFDPAIAGEDDVRFLINHDPSLLLARNQSGTLELSKDDDGLLTEADLPATSYARDLAESMDRKDIDQMSFGFRTIEDSWDDEKAETDDGEEVTIAVRTLEKVELFDVSVVTFPAYPSTDAELNSAAYRYLGVTPAWQGRPVVVRQELQIPVKPTEELLASIDERIQAAVAEAREGKVLSSGNQKALQDAADLIATVLAAAQTESEDGEENAAQAEEAAAIRRALDLRRRRLRLRELEQLPIPTPAPR